MVRTRTNDPSWPVLQAILAQGAVLPTHDLLAETARVSERTVANVVSKLGAHRVVRGGHPAQLGPQLGLVLGISLGAESLRGALVDANGDLFCEDEDDPTRGQHELRPDVLFSRIREMAARVLEKGLADSRLHAPSNGVLSLLGVSVAWPIPLDRAKQPVGRILRDGGWRKLPGGEGPPPSLPQQTAAALGGVFTDDQCHAVNDASAAAIAVAFDESRRRARDPDDDRWRMALVLRIGGAIGAGTIILAPHARSRLSFIDSLLIEGANGLAGELGHLPIGRTLIEDLNNASPQDLADMDYDEWRCSCERTHHLDAFTSGAALVRRLKASGYAIRDDARADTSYLRAIMDGEPDEIQAHAVQDVGRILGRALAGPILMLDPHNVTLTGSLASEYLVEGIRRERDHWANAIKDSVAISYVDRDDGRFIAAKGAALAVIRRAVYRLYLDRRGQLPSVVRVDRAALERLRAR
jgi:predicted NBD/HSP70 family sugar kinase